MSHMAAERSSEPRSVAPITQDTTRAGVPLGIAEHLEPSPLPPAPPPRATATHLTTDEATATPFGGALSRAVGAVDYVQKIATGTITEEGINKAINEIENLTRHGISLEKWNGLSFENRCQLFVMLLHIKGGDFGALRNSMETPAFAANKDQFFSQARQLLGTALHEPICLLFAEALATAKDGEVLPEALQTTVTDRAFWCTLGRRSVQPGTYPQTANERAIWAKYGNQMLSVAVFLQEGRNMATAYRPHFVLTAGTIFRRPMVTRCHLIRPQNATDGAIVVDPGFEGKKIALELRIMGLSSVQKYLLTHGHGDHVSAVEELESEFAAKAVVSSADIHPTGRAHPVNAVLYPSLNKMREEGKIEELTTTTPNRPQKIPGLRGFACTAYAVPGHTTGSVCYHLKAPKLGTPRQRWLFIGDMMFDSIGGTKAAGQQARNLWLGANGKVVRVVLEKGAIVLRAHPKDSSPIRPPAGR